MAFDMAQSIFGREGGAFPELDLSHVAAHRLPGRSAEWDQEANAVVKRDGYLHGFKVERTILLTHEVAHVLAAKLVSPANYDPGRDGARCFFPGMAFSFGEGSGVVDVVICLECSWVAFHANGEEFSLVPIHAFEVELRALYEQMLY